MKFLKNRVVAYILAVLCSLTALLGGTSISVKKQSAKIEQLFYTGVTYDGYLHPSADTQLKDRCNAALGIISMMDNDDVRDLYDARNELMDAESISDKYLSNYKLQLAYERLKPFIGSSAAEKEYCEIMDGAQSLILSSGYNDKVLEFENDILSSFPLNIIKFFVPLKGPESFGLMREF